MRERLEPEERYVMRALPVALCLTVLWGLCLETFGGFTRGASAPVDAQIIPALLAIASECALWSVLMLGAGLMWRHQGLRVCGYAIGAVAMAIVVGYNSAGLMWRPIWNLRALAFAAVVMALAVFAVLPRWLAGRTAEWESQSEAGVALLATGAAFWGVTQETFEFFRYFHGAIGSDWPRYGQMVVSLVWTGWGVALLIAGVVRVNQPVRLMGLAVLGLTAAKLFLVDLSFLDSSLRVFSFGGLGLALIGISWLYTRYGVGDQPAATPRH